MTEFGCFRSLYCNVLQLMFLGSIQSGRGHSRPDSAVQEVPKTLPDGQLLSETGACLLEVWQWPLPCKHSAQIVHSVS